MSELTFSRMQLTDIDEILSIEQESHPAPWNRDAFVRDLEFEPATVEVVKDPIGAIVGYLDCWQIVDEYHILNLTIRSGKRRQGVGTSVMRHIERAARSNGCLYLILEVRVGNDGARAFYEGLGFEEVCVRRRYYSNGEDALILALAL